MNLEMSSIIGGAVAVGVFIRKWANKISKIIQPLVIEAEKLALDGIIDKADRKKLVMKAIELLEKKGLIKLNFITRIIIGRIVNIVASKLPDFKMTENSWSVIDEAKSEIK